MKLSPKLSISSDIGFSHIETFREETATRPERLYSFQWRLNADYEFNRYVGGHDNKVTRFLSRPGLWLQNFTTNEPDDSMLEVAIRALEQVIPEEKGKDAR